MKILLIHTYYTLRGGEDAVFEQESALLGDRNEVKVLTFRNRGGLIGAFQFLLSVWNIFSSIKVRNCIKEFGPDVVHIHNWHFASGPAIIYAASKLKVPVVLTLHNYRLLCPSATLLYDGAIFENSLYSNFPWLAVKNRVYRDSYILTFWLAFIVWLHKKIGTWRRVSKYIVLTDFAKQLILHSNFGIQDDKIIVKPNFVDSIANINNIRCPHFLFVGRLSVEKGILPVLEYFRTIPLEIHIAGEGPLLDQVIEIVKYNSNIKYLGSLSKLEVRNAMSKCSALIFPSIWYEGMPMTILEAFSLGTPIIASNLGAMASMIKDGYNGLHFNPLDFEDFGRQLKYYYGLMDDEKHKFGLNSILTYNEQYTSKVNIKKLLKIYNEIIVYNK